MKVVRGNILDFTEGIICHQVNCKRVAGSGLALQIRNKYPGWWERYRTTIASPGACDLYRVPTVSFLWIASLYGQDGYGTDRRYTNYDHLDNALFELKQLALIYASNYPIYFPYGMGCGLGGGEWKIVSKLIEKHFPGAVIVRWK